MNERSEDLDDNDVDQNEDDRIDEQTGITEMLRLQDIGSEVSRPISYLLILTCGGAG